MTTKTAHAPNTFSWVELGTPSADGAKVFYSTLLGWAFDEMPERTGVTYTLCKIGGRESSGLFTNCPAIKGEAPRWSSFITVEDVDAALKKAVANGAAVVSDPYNVMEAGRKAVLDDPTGGTISLWQPKHVIGLRVVDEIGALGFQMLVTSDLDRASDFYTRTFGWASERSAFGRTFFDPKGGVALACAATLDDLPEGTPSQWLPCFEVEGCQKSAARAVELGGKIFRPPTTLERIGEVALVNDPQRALFALIQRR